MNITVTYTTGTGRANRYLVAYDQTCVVTLSGLTLTGTNWLYLTTTDGMHALANRAEIVTNAATLNLSNTGIESLFGVRQTGRIPALLTVRNGSTGNIAGLASVEITPAADPNVDVVRVGIDYATTSDIADLQSQLDALAVGALNVAGLNAKADAITDATLFVAQETDETVPTKATGAQVATWLGAKYEASGTAAGLMSTHETTHPAPTNRDTRNEAAQSAASQAEAEAGTEAGVRSWSPLRLWQGVAGYLASILTTAGTVLYRGSSGLAALTLRETVRAAGTADDTSLATEAGIRALHGTHNLSASAAPTVDDDETAGWGIGSRWIYDGTEYVCMDPSEGAAVWEATTGAAGIGGSTGGTDNAILRADGTGGATAQASNLGIDDYEAGTQANVGLVAQHATESNVAIRLAPKGTGAIYVGPAADNTTTGGAPRGEQAVDFARGSRNNANEVASGLRSFLFPGTEVRASGEDSIAGGYKSKATGNQSLALLRFSTASGRYGAFALGDYCQTSADSGAAICGGAKVHLQNQFAQGFVGGGAYNYQRSVFCLRAVTSATSASTLFVNGVSSRAILPDQTTWLCAIHIVARQDDGSSGYASRLACIQRTGTTTTLVGSVQTIGTDQWDANLVTPTIGVSADDTNEALDIQVTPANATSTRWLAVIYATEVTY